MLRTLSGRTHIVYTGFCLKEAGGETLTDAEETAVTFRDLAEWEIASYVATGAPLDKAGAYGIQDMSGVFVSTIKGCFYNVVGFPLARFFTRLIEFWGAERVARLLKQREE